MTLPRPCSLTWIDIFSSKRQRLSLISALPGAGRKRVWICGPQREVHEAFGGDSARLFRQGRPYLHNGPPAQHCQGVPARRWGVQVTQPRACQPVPFVSNLWTALFLPFNGPCLALYSWNCWLPLLLVSVQSAGVPDGNGLLQMYCRQQAPKAP